MSNPPRPVDLKRSIPKPKHQVPVIAALLLYAYNDEVGSSLYPVSCAELQFYFTSANIAIVVGYDQTSSIEGKFSRNGLADFMLCSSFNVTVIVFDGLVIPDSIGFVHVQAASHLSFFSPDKACIQPSLLLLQITSSLLSMETCTFLQDLCTYDT